MKTICTDFYACPNGHVGGLTNLANAERISTLTAGGSLVRLKELPGRMGRGFYCGICGTRMHPAAPPGWIDDQASPGPQG